MTIIKNLIPSSLYPLKATYPMVAEAITIHNTASDASARNEIAYMHRNTASTSYHFAVDDIEAVQGLPLDRNGWHAGDGTYGRGNRKTIGIEICYSKSGGSRFKQAEKNAAKLTAQLLKERGWGIDRVKKHQDWSGKYCPHRTLSETGWSNFLSMVQAELTPPKPAPPKEEEDMIETAIMVGSFADFPAAEPLALKLQAPIYLQGSKVMAKHLIIVGGKQPSGFTGKITNLSGKNRFETAAKVKAYLGY